MKQLNETKFLFLIVTFVGLIILSVVGLFLFQTYLKLLSLWLLSVGLFALMRLPDSWKIGLEAFYLLTFIYAYVFGLFFTIPLVIASLLLVVKIRPDEGNGAFCHAIVLSGLAITARLFFSLHGPAITVSQFTFAALLSIAIWLILDIVIAIKSAPVPLPKLMINHTLGLFVNYFLVTLFGFRLLSYFFTLI